MVHPFSRPDRKDAFGGFLPSDKIDEQFFLPSYWSIVVAIVKRGRHSFDIDQLNLSALTRPKRFLFCANFIF